MRYHMTNDVRLLIPEAALQVVFDECDGFDHDETGGRVVGTCEEKRGKLILTITGIIEAGPQAKRSPVSFFQDGEYQEGIFRQIEQMRPETEHLGNWHTHHVNGLDRLSSGDLETYHRTVNHANHNTPFFYAMLVISKNTTAVPHKRYNLKHYLFRRGDDRVYEIAPRHIEVTRGALIWPTLTDPLVTVPTIQDSKPKNIPERARDRDLLGEFYPAFRPFTSARLGLYWRGRLELADGSGIETVVLEEPDGASVKYSVSLRAPSAALNEVAQRLVDSRFPSARVALLATERACNRHLFGRQHQTNAGLLNQEE